MRHVQCRIARYGLIRVSEWMMPKVVFVLLLALLAWSLQEEIAEATGNEAAGMAYAVSEALAGGEPERASSLLRSAPSLQEDGSQSNSAQLGLPMAIFCGVLLTSLSIAIGIGYKRRFDAFAAAAEPDTESGESEVFR